MNALPFIIMKPDEKLLKTDASADVSVRALSDGSSVWAVYIHGGKVLQGYSPQYAVYLKRRTATLQFELPAGNYEVQWWHPRTGAAGSTEQFRHSGGSGTLQSPEYQEDVAALLRKR